MTARWIEFIVTGPRGEPDAFLRGWLAARGLGDAVLDAGEEGFDCAPARERLGKLLHRSIETAHLLVRADAGVAAREAFARETGAARTTASPLALVAEHPVAGARFAFTLATYSAEHFRRLRGMFSPPPEGVGLAPGAEFTESREPEADKAGVYAPVHDFAGSGEGSCEGSIEAILPFWRACRDEELIHADALALVYDAPPEAQA